MAFFALAIVIGCWLSQFTDIANSPFSVLWLPPSLMLVGLMTRGYAVIAPGIVGLVAIMSWQGAPPPLIIAAVLSLVTGPVAAHLVLRRFFPVRPSESNLNRCVVLFAVIASVHAPLSAAVMTLGHSATPTVGFDVLGVFAWRWATEATTGVIFVRGLLLWIPSDGGFCPASALRRSVKTGPQYRQHVPLVLMLVMALGACAIGWAGQGFIEKTMVIPVFGVACVCALVQPRAQAVNAIMLAGLLNALLRLEGFKIGPSTDMQTLWHQLAEFQALLLVGSVLAHLLNALTEERASQASRLRHQALTNVQTDLPNLRSLNRYLARSNAQSDGLTDSLLLAELSVTGLHQWADVVGRTHTAKVEQDIAARLQAAYGDMVQALFHLDTGRYVMSFNTDLEDGAIMKVLHNIFDRSSFRMGEHTVQLQYSVGLLDVPAGSHDPETILASLAIVQRRANQSDANYCRLDLDQQRLRAYREEMEWTETVKSYLENRALRLFAQPIRKAGQLSIVDGGLHFEVLARIEDASGAILTPDRFLPAIAKSGLQFRFDKLVIELALDKLNADPDLYAITGQCAINVTGPTICHPDFSRFLFQALARRAVLPNKISIEITESDSITSLDVAVVNIRKLARLGIRVAVDDFGTGLATFEYIRKLRPDILKIDGAFVTQFETDPLDREVVHSITRLAKSINAQTVAEFVEDEGVANRMEQIGVDYLQGWAISKPMPIEQLTLFASQNQTQAIHVE